MVAAFDDGQGPTSPKWLWSSGSRGPHRGWDLGRRRGRGSRLRL